MKIKSISTAFFAVMVIALIAASASFAQEAQITGAYGDADVKDKGVVSAAKFAVKKGAAKEKATITLLAIKQARMQVVSGLNYEVCLEVNYKKAGKKVAKRYVKAVVYQNLKNVKSLTNWKISNQPLECRD